ncbi:MAG: glycoside hydrolase family 3 C-terminal domain-containing protein [Clostridia bacterium]|nr:glycoside hydrolase family 3 C-terminal domain-containing protein [Clostridia bacterium]
MSEEQENALVASDSLLQEVAADSMVLLKNENDCLPLSKGTKLNLFGYNATDNGFMITGGGSGNSRSVAERTVTLVQALKDAGVAYNEELLAKYAAYDNLDLDTNSSSGPQGTLTNPPESFYTDELMTQAKNYSNTAVVVLSRYGRENEETKDGLTSHYEIPLVQIKSKGLPTDTTRTYLQTSTEEDIMLEKVKANFDNVIVLLNLCNIMECGFLDDSRIDAAMFIGTTGQSGTRAIPKLLYGDITPSGKTADVYAYNHKNDPTWVNALPTPTGNNKHVSYQEGIYYGYRWYETAFADKVKLTVNGTQLDFSTEEGYNKIVQYPFGYGLSYTNFSWEVVEAPADGTEIQEYGEYTVKVRVTNTGTRPGKDVVQLYATPPYTAGGIEKSAINLIAFAKTEELLPANMTENGVPESQVVELTFTDYSLASYDCYDKNNNQLTGYELEKGEYQIKLMKNSHDPATVIPSAASQDSVITMEVKKWDIWMAFDHTTSEFVENRFTGAYSYGSPVDGGLKYMSRENFAGTFPTVRVDGANTKGYQNGAQNKYQALQTITYGQDNGMYFATKADGSKASLTDLNGTTQTELKYNDELLEKLHDYDDNETWNKFLSQITKEETVDIIKNGGFQIAAVESIGLPRMTEQDGPSGFGNTVLNEESESTSTGWCSSALVGCSWNKKLAYNQGRSIGMEAKNIVNKQGWYAPGVNLHRSPYNSRNFEYYSEDPVLSGEMGAEVIRGAKNNGLICYLKHFAVSEGGKNPFRVDTWITEQAMREIYLKAFEIAVKKGGANAVMSAFNNIGDVFCGFNQALLNDILRTEWGFRGQVITDWWKVYMIIEQCVLGGNDKMLMHENTT